MADLLALSTHMIDQGIWDGPGSVNRVTTELSVVGDGIAMVEAFSHVVAFSTDDGLVLFDTSLEAMGGAVLKSLRGWSQAPVNTIAYTHGHIDHVGGCGHFMAEARDAGHTAPRVVAHENVPPRFGRYELTNGYNAVINTRQFLRAGAVAGMGGERFGPEHWVQPEITFRDRLRQQVGGLDIELRHAIGETDDHLWAWLPQRKAICAGDFVTWVFPNAGNPQKVQRYPLEWANALREMASLEPELLLPAHGLPVEGKARIRTLLDDLAGALEHLVRETIALMNEGATLDTVLQNVRLPQELIDKPYMRPVYDEPEFVLHNVWRLYGGWYEGNPARLKPAPASAVATELANLAGGPSALVQRAQQLAENDDYRLACELVELATQAAPEDREAHAVRAEIYAERRKRELSTMAKGVYGWAARESRRVASGDPNAD